MEGVESRAFQPTEEVKWGTHHAHARTNSLTRTITMTQMVGGEGMMDGGGGARR